MTPMMKFIKSAFIYETYIQNQIVSFTYLDRTIIDAYYGFSDSTYIEHALESVEKTIKKVKGLKHRKEITKSAVEQWGKYYFREAEVSKDFERAVKETISDAFKEIDLQLAWYRDRLSDILNGDHLKTNRLSTDLSRN